MQHVTTILQVRLGVRGEERARENRWGKRERKEEAQKTRKREG
jgi:hypothetical protein